MATTLVSYGTTEGQTARIAQEIAKVLRDLGHVAEVLDVHDLKGAVPARCTAVILGASIHVGKHDKHVVEFARRNRDTLQRLPSAFFSVSLAAHGDREEAEGYISQFQDQTGWRPDQTACFGGALLYTHYGFIKRRMMKRIAADKPGSLGLDTSRDYVYTDWDAVKTFAEQFAQKFEHTSG